MRIRNLVHKGLRQLYEDDISRGVPPDTVEKLRKMLTYLDEMESADELPVLPMWKAHRLSGNRRSVWSLSVTANRRLTFRIDEPMKEICDLNLEDYH